jgi:transmembrane sensor
MGEQRSSLATPDQWALRWLKALPGGDRNVRAAFASWVRRSPRYVEAYCRQKMLDTELQGLDPERRIDVQVFIQHAQTRIQAQGKVVPWPLAARRLPPRPLAGGKHLASGPPRLGVIALLFSMGVLMIGPLISLQLSIQRILYTTAPGQQQRARLPDGSSVWLNSQSQIQVQFSSARREVRLLRGEALFTVVHDARKPFHVRVGNTIVEDVGTTFDVRLGAHESTIAVVEGRVRLTRDMNHRVAAASPRDYLPVILAQNEEAIVSDGGAPVTARISSRELESLTAWTSRLVIVDGMTLAQAVQEFNCYNTVQLRLADADVGRLKLGGSFDLATPLVFATSLRDLGCEIAADEGNVIVVSKCNFRPDANAAGPGSSGLSSKACEKRDR